MRYVLDPCECSRLPTRTRAHIAGASGFSLIELMVVLVIVGIFLSLALPSFSHVNRSNRATAQSNGLLTALNLARTEAIIRRTRVSVCAGTGSTCASGGAAWGDGWIVFVDRNAPGMASDDDEVLRVWPAVKKGDSLVGDGALVSFRSDGFAETAANWVLKPGACESDQQRAVRLVASGRSTVSREACS